MSRPRILWWLRIAFSVCCAIVCLSLITLCVRSHSWIDTASWGTVNSITLSEGRVFANEAFSFTPQPTPKGRPLIRNFVGDRITVMTAEGGGWAPVSGSNGIPIWLLVVAAAGASVLPWIGQLPWKFSLRTLLIATTLIAVALGAVVYSLR
jgi:hypothetical protein